MKKAFIFGNNSIGQFLVGALNILDYDAVDITDTEDLSSIFDTKKLPEFIIDVVNGFESQNEEEALYHNKEGLAELLMYANRYKIPYLFVYKEPANLSRDSSLAYAFETISEISKRSKLVSKIQIEDIYGVDINTSRELSEIINTVLHLENINVEDDLSEMYLLHQKDFVSGIMRCANDIKRNNWKSIYTLFPESSITVIEVAYLVSELVDYECEIEYISEAPIEKNITVDSETTYPKDWFPIVELEHGLIELLEFSGIKLKGKEKEIIENSEQESSTEEDSKTIELNQEISPPVKQIDSDPLDLFAPRIEEVPTKLEEGAKYYRPERNEKKSQMTTKENAKKVAVVLSLLLILSTFIPSVKFAYSYSNVTKETMQITNLIKNKSYEQAQNRADDNLKKIEKLKSVPIYIKLLSFVTSKSDQNLIENLTYLEKSLQLQSYLSRAYINIDSLSPKISSGIIAEENSKVLGIETDETSDFYTDKISELNIDLSSLKFNKTYLSSTQLDDTKEYLSQASMMITKIQGQELRMLLGYDEGQNYLYFVQDTDETRATGGKIEQFGIMTIDNGIFSFENPSKIGEFDDQIKLNNIQIAQAPRQIRTLENSRQLLPSDLNWNPDFQKTANLFSLYYSAAYGERTNNGVISMNKDMFLKLKNNDISNNDKFDLFLANLQKGNILISHKNGQIKTWINKNNWDGSLLKYTNDYLSIIDTNLSRNKINQNIERSTKFMVSPPKEDTGYVRDLSITYVNNNPISSDKKFNYTANVRIYTPVDTMLNSAYLVNNDSNEKTTVTRSVTSEIDGKYNVFSIDIQVQEQNKVEIQLQYQSAYKEVENSKLNIVVQKQNGYRIEDFTVIATYPLGMPSKIPSIYKIESNSIKYTQKLESDSYIDVPL